MVRRRERIHCLCVVKNERDVLDESIAAAAEWADSIYIADHQSDDGTPEVIRGLVARFPNVFDAGAITEPFSDGMRARVFARVKSASRHGDWWCRLDADEFYLDDPRDFLGRLRPQIDTVWSSHYQFYFTERDAAAYEADPAAFVATPVRQRLRYYRNNSSEIRFVRHVFPLLWYREWPRFRCAATTARIRTAHYQYRSPEQIVRRLSVRREIAARSRGYVFPHELGSLHDWGAHPIAASGGERVIAREAYWDRVMPSAELDRDTGDGLIDRGADLRPVTDVWDERVPFALWKPFVIARALLDVRRFIPDRIRRALERSKTRR